jgi:predicted TIM-barrel fold metal-dependent hydrolase
VDVHVHLYPDPAAGQTAKDRYDIWEYGADPGVVFSPASGELSELRATYAGWDRVVVVHIFDADLAREEARARLAAGPAVDDAGVTAAIDEAVGGAMRESNRWVVGATADDPMLEVLVSVDPTVLSPSEMVAHLEDLAAGGVRGIKLHPVSQGYVPSDPRLDGVYRTCADAGLVVLSHSGQGHHGGASARPAEFGPVLERWPHLRMVLAHLGGAAWTETAALAEAYPQVVFDLSEIVEWSASHSHSAPDPAALSALIRSVGADRVMLGSDFPWYDPAHTADRVLALPGLGTVERAAVLGGTALEVFDLERGTRRP